MKNMHGSVVSVGVDVHYKFSTVAMVDDQGRVVRRERLEHADRQALRRRLAKWPAGAPAVLEASFGWGWLSDEMEKAGIPVRLSNCHKVEKMRQARGLPKNNDKDASLLALLPGEKDNWWEVWRAPREVRDRREWMRHRMDLVGMQTQVKCRIHAIFHRHGIFHNFSDLFGSGGRRFLEALCEGKDPQSRCLGPGAAEALRDEVVLLMQLRQALARIASMLRKELDRRAQVRWLMSVPGFGLILSHVVLAEMGDIRRFRRARSLANYSLLGPRCNDTGEPPGPGQTPLGRHLGQRGNRVLKWAFIEAAHGAVRHEGLWREMFRRVTDNGRRDRGRGYIKVARALVDVAFAVLRDQREYQENRPARPEAAGTVQSPSTPGIPDGKTTSQAPRPGTGRPSRPMVAAASQGRVTSS
jgi:transposase